MRTGPNLPQLVDAPCWEVTPPDLTKFLEELYAFVPAGSVLCLEGTEAPDIERYLKARPGPFENETNQGFLKMRPKVYFIPITAENLQGVASLSTAHAEPEVCSHLPVYREKPNWLGNLAKRTTSWITSSGAPRSLIPQKTS